MSHQNYPQLVNTPQNLGTNQFHYQPKFASRNAYNIKIGKRQPQTQNVTPQTASHFTSPQSQGRISHKSLGYPQNLSLRGSSNIHVKRNSINTNPLRSTDYQNYSSPKNLDLRGSEYSNHSALNAPNINITRKVVNSNPKKEEPIPVQNIQKVQTVPSKKIIVEEEEPIFDSMMKETGKIYFFYP